MALSDVASVVLMGGVLLPNFCQCTLMVFDAVFHLFCWCVCVCVCVCVCECVSTVEKRTASTLHQSQLSWYIRIHAKHLKLLAQVGDWMIQRLETEAHMFLVYTMTVTSKYENHISVLATNSMTDYSLILLIVSCTRRVIK